MVTKQDSNLTGLRYAQESAVIKVLPGSPVWYPLEPNSYSDFGGQIATVARDPINSSRQRKKGTVTDLDASGSFNQDLVTGDLTRLLQGFFCADAKGQVDTQSLAGATATVTAVTASSDTYTLSGALDYPVLEGALIYATGFAQSGNNGLKVNIAQGTTTLTVAASPGLTNETPSSAARILVVGQEFIEDDLSIEMNGDLVRIVSNDALMGNFLVEPGDWIYVGGDTSGTRFDSNQGFARVSAVTSAYMELDKVSWPAQAESSGGKTIRLFFGRRIRNNANIAYRTYQLERTLGNDGVGTQSEYLVGAVPNELTLNVATADKVTIDLAFIALDNEQRSGTTGVKSGTRPTLVSGNALNTSSDFKRINIGAVSTTDATVTPLLAYVSDLTLTANNNAQALKAIGTLGGFDASLGTFEVGGTLEAYFADVAAIAAIRNNADITIDLAIVENNKGLVIDLPLISLGDGRLNIEKDQAIKIPLENSAFENPLGYTIQYQEWLYLPDAAESPFVDIS
jgi:hypothetical protein